MSENGAVGQFDPGLLTVQRANFHRLLTQRILIIEDDKQCGSNGDKDNDASRRLSLSIAQQLGAKSGNRLPAQSSGVVFENATKDFLESTFLNLESLRPGHWNVKVIQGRDALALAEFEQYGHLSDISEALKEHRQLKAILGNEYVISPDIVIARGLVDDAHLNENKRIVDGTTAKLASIRQVNGGRPILHASISCKWTIRSDRSQNSRSEALNLIRSRKGRVPHIAIVTGEPLPSRIASVALGTGDIDCVYHFALNELQRAVSILGQSEAQDLLEIMIEGKRLKDISDLPLDLAT